MRLGYLLKERIDGGIGAASTGYLGKFPSLASVYNWGYKGYFQGGEEDPVAELSPDAENHLIDQAVDLMYTRFPEIIKNKEIKRHMLQMLVGQITQGELKDRGEMEKFIKRLKKRTGVETV